MADVGDPIDVLEDCAAQAGGPVGEKVRAVQRPRRDDARVVGRKILTEVEAFLHVGDAGGELAADGEPASPRAAAVRHRDRRLLGLGECEELTRELLDARLERGWDSVPDDAEKSRVAARTIDLGRERGGIGAPGSRDVDDREVLHDRPTRAGPGAGPSCRPSPRG